MTRSSTTPVIHVTSRGFLYDPSATTRSMWITAATTMKLAPKKWSPRRIRPKVTRSMM
jgi:hypothetical protein